MLYNHTAMVTAGKEFLQIGKEKIGNFIFLQSQVKSIMTNLPQHLFPEISINSRPGRIGVVFHNFYFIVKS
jgi:hypothetical protein